MPVTVPQSGRQSQSQSHFYFPKRETMNKELVLKLLAALGVKTGTGSSEMKEDDAVKLVTDLFAAENKGLVDKRDDLLAQEIKLKEKISALETGASENAKKLAELDAQLKKNNPEDYKKFYEDEAKTLNDKHAAELAVIMADRDKYKNSHETRVRNDALADAVKDIKFCDGLQNGFIALALQNNQFTPKEIDGKTVFYNQENKTIQAVIHELSLSNEGKAYIKNGNQGGGSSGGTNLNAGTGSGGTAPNAVSMTLAQFDALTDQAKMDFASKGGQVTE